MIHGERNTWTNLIIISFIDSVLFLFSFYFSLVCVLFAFEEYEMLPIFFSLSDMSFLRIHWLFNRFQADFRRNESCKLCFFSLVMIGRMWDSTCQFIIFLHIQNPLPIPNHSFLAIEFTLTEFNWLNSGLTVIHSSAYTGFCNDFIDTVIPETKCWGWQIKIQKSQNPLV